ncbi:hypothetical protein HY485_05435 [Candidatus Woesearchaeota archaeon]|nr:hypothetical protein [Candidatus Woesearchaeota archaeon]
MSRTELPLEYFLSKAESIGLSKDVLLDHFVPHWDGFDKKDDKLVSKVDGKVYDRFEDIPVRGLFYPCAQRKFSGGYSGGEFEHLRNLDIQLNGVFDHKLILSPDGPDNHHWTCRDYYHQNAPVKDPFALVASGKIVPESYYFGFGFAAHDEYDDLIGEHSLTVKIQNGFVVEAPFARGVLEETARMIRSVIGDQVPVVYRPVLDWMLAAYKGPEVPKLSYEDLV